MDEKQSYRISGWILPDGSWHECRPWEHIKFAKTLEFVSSLKNENPSFSNIFNDPDEEKIRIEFARQGMVKVCYHYIDADYLNETQLKALQEIYSLAPPDEEIDFVGKIKARIPIRIFLKIKDFGRLNNLSY
ncbi:MAG: hypothetical protein K2X39_05550 [Silvanigrellaceae bacterium]|nr:hypothetical protein [Silvanigrellaceae bacterium]